MKSNLRNEFLDTMSKDPGNWKGQFYFNKKDPRIIVPRFNPMLGWTLNFASPYAYIGSAALIALIILFSVFI